MNGSFTIEIVAVKSVDWHDDDNPRVCDNIDARVADLLQSDPDLWEPIVVAPLGGGRYYGIDGYARHTTAKQLGIANLRARVEQLPQDVRDRSFALNRLHGFHLSIVERKAHAQYLHERYPDLSWAEIGKRCAISDHTAKAACLEDDEPSSQVASSPLRELPDDDPRVVLAFLKKIARDRASWSSAKRAAQALRPLIPEARFGDFVEALGRAAERALDVAEALGYAQGGANG